MRNVEESVGGAYAFWTIAQRLAEAAGHYYGKQAQRAGILAVKAIPELAWTPGDAEKLELAELSIQTNRGDITEQLDRLVRVWRSTQETSGPGQK